MRPSIFTRAFWTAASERAVKTGAQAVLTTYLVGDVALNAITADWANMGGIFAGGILVSYLTSLASAQVSGTPSLGAVEVPAKQPVRAVRQE